MKLIFKIFIFLFCFKSFSQEDFKDSIWLNDKWEVTDKTRAVFYRVYKKTEKGFVVYDKYLNNQIQMIAEVSQVKPKLRYEGYSVHFNKDGSKYSRGFFTNDQKSGIWTQYFEHGKDSSVYEVMPDGKTKYIYKSPLQKDEIYTIVEKQAEFPGGISEMMVFIQKNVKYPSDMINKRIGGKSLIKFVIDESGKVYNNPVVEKSSGMKELDEEAVRVVALMPQWKPATLNNKAVKCWFNVPITFGLQEPYFVFNNKNNNLNYSTLSAAIKENDLHKIWNTIKEVNDSEIDQDYLFLKGILYYHNSKKKDGCLIFEKIISSTGEDFEVNKLSKKYIQKYCN